MTQISPRHRDDIATLHAAAHHRAAMQALRGQIIEVTCAVGLVILAAAAGYLMHIPTTCAPAPAFTIDPN